MAALNAERMPGSRAMSAGAAFAVVAAGVSAALHLGKLAPALPALRAELGVSLVQGGFLLSLVQVAGMTLGLLVGLMADAIGLRRCMLLGLALLIAASLAGGWVDASPHAVALLLLLRGVEGVGFLLVVMPGPGLIRTLVAPGAQKSVMGLWGSYMPLGWTVALLVGPAVIAWSGWHGWWWVLSLVSLGAAAWVVRVVPADAPRAARGAATPWTGRLRQTLGAAGPQALALSFAVYSAQWIAVIGFLPAIYAEAGVATSVAAVLTAVAAAVNIVGNLGAGRLLQHGVAPQRLLVAGFLAMGLASVAAFAQWGTGADAVALPPALRFVAVCLFSAAGGLVPATLFMLSVRLAPSAVTVSTTVGMMQQTSSLGQFLSPPFVAWLAHRVGGWQWTWAAMVVCGLAGMVLAGRLAALHRRVEETHGQ